MPNQLDVISVLFFCKKSLLTRHAFALFERTTSIYLKSQLNTTDSHSYNVLIAFDEREHYSY